MKHSKLLSFYRILVQKHKSMINKSELPVQKCVFSKSEVPYNVIKWMCLNETKNKEEQFNLRIIFSHSSGKCKCICAFK